MANLETPRQSPKQLSPQAQANPHRPGWLLPLLALLAVASCATTRATSAAAVATTAFGPDPYPTLVARAKAGDPTVDFRALRLAFLTSPARQEALRWHDALQNLHREEHRAYETKDHVGVARAARRILAVDYVDIPAHRFLRDACSALGDRHCAHLEQFVLQGLLESIGKNRDGFSCPSAWEVFTVAEEQDCLFLAGTQELEQELWSDRGHYCDKLEVVDVKTGHRLDWFFNVDVMMQDEVKDFHPPPVTEKARCLTRAGFGLTPEIGPCAGSGLPLPPPTPPATAMIRSP
jgi:hypothetical protein